MATTRPFAYNPGSSINGTTQYGQIAVGDIDTSYSSDYGDVKWWMGPDESVDGYLIAIAVPSNTQPTEIPGTSASIGFYRSKGCSEQDFLDLLAVLPFSKNETFTSGDNAKSWLNNNGYWTSWGVTTPICNGNPAPTPTPSSTNSLILPTPTPTPTPSATINLIVDLRGDNLSSYPTSGNTWFDVSGYGNNGAITNATFSSDYGGVFNFDGNGDYIAIGQPLSNGSSYTLNAWVNASEVNLARNIISSTSSPFWINGGSLYGGIANNYTAVTSSSFPTNQWVYVTVTFDDVTNTMRLYKDGVLVNQNTNVTDSYSAENMYIGAHYTISPVSFFIGMIGEVSIYDGAINGTQVSQNYDNTKARYILAPTSTPTPTPTNTVTPSASNTMTPTPTPSASAAGGGGISGGEYLFYSDEGVVNLGAPLSNGNITFINGSYETYNPNYTGGTLYMYFNRFTASGVDNLNSFTGLTSTGGTISLTQNGDTASFSGVSMNFGYNNMGGTNGFLQFSITGSSQQLISSTNPFVSGTTISLSINGSSGGGGSTPTPTPSTSGIPVTPSVTPTNTPTNTTTPTNTPTNTQTPTVTPTNTVTPTITPSSTPAPIVYKMIAVGGNTGISASNDGTNWVESTTNAAIFLTLPVKAAAASSNMFVVGGDKSTNSLIYSYDGANWSGSTNGATMFGTQVNGIAYGNGMWVAVGVSSGAAKIAYSTDGITWTAAANSNIFGSTPTAVAYEPTSGRWVATANKGGANNNTIAYSDDGINWSAAYNSWTVFSGTCRSVVHDGTKWLAVGDGINRMAYSTDGYQWYAVPNGNTLLTSIGYGIASNGTQTIAVGQGTNKIIYSNDGINWSGATNNSSIFSVIGYCVTYDYNNNKWIAGGLGTNQLAISTDGINWTATSNGNTIMNDRVRAIASKH